MTNNFCEIKNKLPKLGVGLGFRSEVFQETLDQTGRIDWLEIISEQYMNAGGKSLDLLERAASVFPLIPHGVNLSLGSTDSISSPYKQKLKQLLDKLDPPWWSDHLCFTSHGGVYMNELLPLPFTKETAKYVAQRGRMMQELMERPFLFENITFYMKMPGSEMTEAQFISEVLEQSGCGLLLDINNVYVNSLNHGFDPYEFLKQIPIERTVQIHVAGHIHAPEFKAFVDTHGEAIVEPVFDLLRYVMDQTDVKAVLLERDQNFPDDFNDILLELDEIRSIAGKRLSPEHKSTGHGNGDRKQERIVLIKSNGESYSDNDPEPPENLSKVEQGMQKLWMSPDVSDRFVHGDETQISKEIAAEVDQSRLPIYVNVIHNGFQNAMEKAFPLCALVLKPSWRGIVADYMSLHPPQTYEMTYLGEAFPKFISENVFERYKKTLPFLVELADYERIETEILHHKAIAKINDRCDLATPAEFTNYGPIVNPVLMFRKYEYPMMKIVERLEQSKRVPRNVKKSKTELVMYRDPSDFECRCLDVGPLASAIIEKARSSACSYAELATFAISSSPGEAPQKLAGEFVALVATLNSCNVFIGDQKLHEPESLRLNEMSGVL